MNSSSSSPFIQASHRILIINFKDIIINRNKWEEQSKWKGIYCYFRAASPAGSESQQFLPGFLVWPEWNHEEVSKEKWDLREGAEDEKVCISQSAINAEF